MLQHAGGCCDRRPWRPLPTDPPMIAFVAAGQEISGTPDLPALLSEEWARLRAFVRLRMGPELRACESASDIAQDVCVALLGRTEAFEWQGRERFRHWLCSTALNKIRQRLRHYGVRRRVGPSRCAGADQNVSECCAHTAEPLDDLMSGETAKRIEAAVDALPINLRRVVGLSYAAIAAERGTSEGAVRILMHRALARLGTLLDGES